MKTPTSWRPTCTTGRSSGPSPIHRDQLEERARRPTRGASAAGARRVPGQAALDHGVRGDGDSRPAWRVPRPRTSRPTISRGLDGDLRRARRLGRRLVVLGRLSPPAPIPGQRPVRRICSIAMFASTPGLPFDVVSRTRLEAGLRASIPKRSPARLNVCQVSTSSSAALATRRSETPSCVAI